MLVLPDFKITPFDLIFSLYTEKGKISGCKRLSYMLNRSLK